jgi:hypothetical protein
VKGVDHADNGAKDHALPVVRYAGRRGGEILRFRVQEFEDRQDQPLWKRGIRGSRQEGGSELAKEGEEGPCGWLKDKFGLSWQVIPKALPEMLMDGNSETAQRVMRSMLQMRKIDIAALRRAQAA